MSGRLIRLLTVFTIISVAAAFAWPGASLADDKAEQAKKRLKELFEMSRQESSGGDKSEQVKKRLLEMFELSKNDKFQELAGYIVYSGDDETRAWKDLANPNDPLEMQVVKNTGNRIKELLQGSESYKFERFVVEEESEGEWAAWFLSFKLKHSTESNQVIFAFLEINGKYCLGDID